jgi:hypothetical protein
VATIGDLDNNGVDDLAVGAIGETAVILENGGTTTYVGAGALYILLLAHDGSVKSSVRIGSLVNGGPRLEENGQFGYSVAALGDMDGDGIPDVVVGAPGITLPAVYILYLNRNGTVRENMLIRGTYGNSTLGSYLINGPPVKYGSRFGSALAAMGDMNGDGVTEIAVSSLDSSGGSSRVYIMFMASNGTVLSYSLFGPGQGGGPEINDAFSGFGSALLQMPDFNGDGVPELVVGAKYTYDAGSVNRRAGKSFFCFMNATGLVKSYVAIGELSLGPSDPMPNVVRRTLPFYVSSSLVLLT